MNIALTHPFCWPYVRRGAERFISELGRFLISRGHTVTTISSKPGPSCVERGPDGVRILHRQWWNPLLAHARLQPAHGFLIPCYTSIRHLRPEIVQSLYYVDAWAAQLGRRKHKTVYYIAGPPIPALQRRIPPDRRILRKAIERADALLVPSEYIRGLVWEYYGRRAELLPVPVHAAEFRGPKYAQASRPIILSLACFQEPRKGLRVIVRAFARLRERIPDAVLWISGYVPSHLQREVLERLPSRVRPFVQFLGVGSVGDLPELYRRASITVVAATWEAYSLVILESWAAGTPVVTADHAALPELVTDPATGVLFNPGPNVMEPSNHEGLVWAMERALDLAACAHTEQRCRMRADQYSWDRLGGSFERFYLSLLSSSNQ